ncbi:MAG: shikimate dehydrogenase [Magnetospiraceae bacterium]
MALTGKAKLAGVAGWPVGHSLSPRLHGYWLDLYGIDGAYVPLSIDPKDFPTVLRTLPKMGFSGTNVTVPHKEAAYQTVDEVTDRARVVKAVNTVIVRPDGSLLGDNTDGFGFLENLIQRSPGFDPTAGPAVVLGAGGAARGIIAALLEAGAPEIRLANRTRSRAETLAEDIPGAVHVYDVEATEQYLKNACLFVNTTTLGMDGQEAEIADFSALPIDALVTDIVYVPLQTPLLQWAAARGNPTVDGLGMLLHQARPGFEAWFGVVPEVTDDLHQYVLMGLET